MVIAVLAGTLGLVGCGDDATNGTAGAGGSAGSGGTAGGGGGVPTCESTACILCPEEALGPNGFLFGDLNIPLVFTAVPQGPVVQGGTVTIDVAGRTQISDLPVPVSANVEAGSTTTYIATTGGDGTLDIPIPEQTLMGTDLDLDAGSGSGPFDVDADATELVIRLNSAVINIEVTSPLPLSLTIDASDSGGCSVVGNGVSIPVSGAGGAGGGGGGGGGAGGAGGGG
jgi:hypothetical protein